MRHVEGYIVVVVVGCIVVVGCTVAVVVPVVKVCNIEQAVALGHIEYIEVEAVESPEPEAVEESE